MAATEEPQLPSDSRPSAAASPLPVSLPSAAMQDRQPHHAGNEAIDSDKSSPNGNLSLFSLAYLLGPVTKNHADLALLTCCFVTGLVDAAVFANYTVFVGMQTGNTVILGLSTAQLSGSPYAWLTTLVSLGSFLVGCFATFRITRVLAPEGPYSNRLVVLGLFFVQSGLIILSAALATPEGLIPQKSASAKPNSADELTTALVVALIPPLAFQSGMQIASSRLLGYNELPVNVLTSTYCDLAGDFNLFALNNVKRNRRAAAALLLLLGAICSGWLMRSAGGLKSVLWLAGGIKLMVAMAILGLAPASELVRTLSRDR